MTGLRPLHASPGSTCLFFDRLNPALSGGSEKLIAMSRNLVFFVSFDKARIQEDVTIGKCWRREASVHGHFRDAGGSGAKGSVNRRFDLEVQKLLALGAAGGAVGAGAEAVLGLEHAEERGG